MRCFLVLLFLLCSTAFAQGTTYFLGIRQSKYGYVGVQPFRHWGVRYDNSLFSQSVEYQYGRLALFYSFDTPFNMRGTYSFFYGMRYNQDYYDWGGELNCTLALHPKYFRINGILQPKYDSDIKEMVGYSVSLQTLPLQEVGLLMGFRNLPDFRDVERRAFVGMIFETERLKVVPEVSTPIATKMESTRVAISFVYRNGI